MIVDAKKRQDDRDAAIRKLSEFWAQHKKEYVEVRGKEIEFGKKAYKVEKAIKSRAKEADLIVADITLEGELMVIVDRHVRILG